MALITLLLLAAAAYLVFTYHFKSQRAPAGLRDVPVAGKLNELGEYPQRQWRKWARQHGELFQIRLGWENWVFVNSPEAVKDIFNKQSQHTSSRAPSPVVSNIISGGMRLLFMPYTPKWQKLRAIVRQVLTLKSSNAFIPSQEFEAKQLLWDILTDNANQEDFYMHIR
ncbi:cytochrome P450 [Penicillium odoratum]|uniref:cytochrome P450 n=1 Tax=Penicillium odoratum TaxID=1167516 RepID=UPI00254681F7|nr:cytochrome P450 [Penicillium odoratum]KAJ5751752.1 cytochrome P450 [Penicillium odoratum]